ncbi:MAG: 2TM domain-containing protein [Alphaproteobacteria bacterium]|nr:2TM domain-containing protein [Alphaproteobacteria bacterium]
MTHEEAIRKRVKTLKQFYMDVFTFILVNSIIILIWCQLALKIDPLMA